MKKILFTLMMLVATTATMSAQDDPIEQTDAPVIHYYYDEYGSSLPKIVISHDDPDAVIYWRYTLNYINSTNGSDWMIYTEPVEFSFWNYPDVDEVHVESYAVSPGKAASEITGLWLDPSVGVTAYVIPPLVYVNHVDEEGGLAIRIVDGLIGDNNDGGYYNDYIHNGDYYPGMGNYYINYEYQNPAPYYFKPEHYYYKINDSDEWTEYDGEIYLKQYGEYKIIAKTTNGNLVSEASATVVYDSTGYMSQDGQTIVRDGLVYYTDGDSVASVADYYFEHFLYFMKFPIISPERSGDMVIPAVIHINNHDYNVERIGCNAFAGFSSVTIPNSVTLFDLNYYDGHDGYPHLPSITVAEGNPVYDSRENCNAVIETASNKLILGCLNTVIPASVVEVGPRAFFQCFMTTLICKAKTPPTVYEYSFSDIYEQTTLFVPAESLEAYQSHEEWGKFLHIVPFLGAGPGDINGDGNIAISDVTSLIDMLLSGDDMPAYADVNGDGVVTIKDVTDLIDMLLCGN